MPTLAAWHLDPCMCIVSQIEILEDDVCSSRQLNAILFVAPCSQATESSCHIWIGAGNLPARLALGIELVIDSQTILAIGVGNIVAEFK
jgi:hypothetical protein